MSEILFQFLLFSSQRWFAHNNVPNVKICQPKGTGNNKNHGRLTGSCNIDSNCDAEDSNE
ncbi:MAG: hypothetical protein ACPG9M_07585 [Schleiferiaceae bacterium]